MAGTYADPLASDRPLLWYDRALPLCRQRRFLSRMLRLIFTQPLIPRGFRLRPWGRLIVKPQRLRRITLRKPRYLQIPMGFRIHPRPDLPLRDALVKMLQLSLDIILGRAGR